MNSILKKSLSAIMVFCLMFLCLGLSVRVNAIDCSVTYTIASTTSVTTTGTVVEGSSATFNNTYTNNKQQLTKGNSMTLTLQGYEGMTIKSITLSMRSNSKAGAGSFTMIAGDTLLSEIQDGTFEDNWYGAYSGSFVDVTPNMINSSYTVQESENIVITISATTNSLYCQSFKIIYDDPNSKGSIVLSNEKSQCKLGETIQLTKEVTGIEEPYELDWVVESSNGGVATVDENGIFNATAFGTFNVSAKIGDVASTPVTLKVYPDNTNPITAEVALEVCEMTGTTQTDWQYSVDGTVSNVNGNYVTISDGTGDITAYGLKNVIQGERVLVSGFLVNYYNKNTSEYVPEFTSGCTALKYFSVTFDSNGGSTVSPLEEVLEGTTISTPTEPTNEGYSLAGWYNGNSQWNFATDTVTSNITLTAKWVLSNLETVFDDLNNVDAYMSMAYSYNINGEIKTDELNRDFTGVSGTSYAEWSGKTSNSTAVYAGQSAGGKDSIQLKSNDSISGIVTTTSGGYARKITVQWNSNTAATRTLDIYGSNTAYESASDLYGDSKGTKLGSIVIETSTELVIEGDYQYIGIRSNSGALYLDSISIEWSTVATSEMYSNMEFRLGAGIDKDIADLASQLDNAKYGIEVSDGEKTEKYYSSDSLFKNNLDNDIFYVVISLGDIFNNKERVDIEFTVKAFIEYDGDTYYSSLSKTYSVKTLVEKYLSDDATKEAVQPLKEALENLGYTFE